MFVASRIDYRRYQAPWFVYGALAFTVVCLVAVFAFPEINGASRWIRFGGFSFQPSEMAKITLPLFLAYFLTKNETSVGELRSTVVPCIGALVLLGGLIFLEPDLGTAIVLCAIFSAVYFAAGAKIVHITSVAALMVVAGSRCDPSCTVACGAIDGVSRSVQTFGRRWLPGCPVALRDRFGWGSRRGFCERHPKAFLFAVPVLRFYLFGRRGRIWISRHARGRARVWIVAMAGKSCGAEWLRTGSERCLGSG